MNYPKSLQMYRKMSEEYLYELVERKIERHFEEKKSYNSIGDKIRSIFKQLGLDIQLLCVQINKVYRMDLADDKVILAEADKNCVYSSLIISCDLLNAHCKTKQSEILYKSKTIDDSNKKSDDILDQDTKVISKPINEIVQGSERRKFLENKETRNETKMHIILLQEYQVSPYDTTVVINKQTLEENTFILPFNDDPCISVIYDLIYEEDEIVLYSTVLRIKVCNDGIIEEKLRYYHESTINLNKKPKLMEEVKINSLGLVMNREFEPIKARYSKAFEKHHDIMALIKFEDCKLFANFSITTYACHHNDKYYSFTCIRPNIERILKQIYDFDGKEIRVCRSAFVIIREVVQKLNIEASGRMETKHFIEPIFVVLRPADVREKFKDSLEDNYDLRFCVYYLSKKTQQSENSIIKRSLLKPKRLLLTTANVLKEMQSLGMLPMRQYTLKERRITQEIFFDNMPSGEVVNIKEYQTGYRLMNRLTIQKTFDPNQETCSLRFTDAECEDREREDDIIIADKSCGKMSNKRSLLWHNNAKGLIIEETIIEPNLERIIKQYSRLSPSIRDSMRSEEINEVKIVYEENQYFNVKTSDNEVNYSEHLSDTILRQVNVTIDHHNEDTSQDPEASRRFLGLINEDVRDKTSRIGETYFSSPDNDLINYIPYALPIIEKYSSGKNFHDTDKCIIKFGIVNWSEFNLLHEVETKCAIFKRYPMKELRKFLASSRTTGMMANFNLKEFFNCNHDGLDKINLPAYNIFECYEKFETIVTLVKRTLKRNIYLNKRARIKITVEEPNPMSILIFRILTSSNCSGNTTSNNRIPEDVTEYFRDPAELRKLFKVITTSDAMMQKIARLEENQIPLIFTTSMRPYNHSKVCFIKRYGTFNILTRRKVFLIDDGNVQLIDEVIEPKVVKLFCQECHETAGFMRYSMAGYVNQIICNARLSNELINVFDALSILLHLNEDCEYSQNSSKVSLPFLKYKMYIQRVFKNFNLIKDNFIYL